MTSEEVKPRKSKRKAVICEAEDGADTTTALEKKEKRTRKDESGNGDKVKKTKKKTKDAAADGNTTNIEQADKPKMEKSKKKESIGDQVETEAEVQSSKEKRKTKRKAADNADVKKEEGAGTDGQDGTGSIKKKRKKENKEDTDENKVISNNDETSARVEDKKGKDKKRKRSGEEEDDMPADASDQKVTNNPDSESTGAPDKKKKRRKKKTPKPKAKPTAIQKLKQRQSMREKLLAKEGALDSNTEKAGATEETKVSEPDTVKGKSLLVAPPSAPGESKRRQAAVEYLQQYVTDRENWKFQKVRQVWILRNLWYTHQLNDEAFALALQYIKDLSHKAREETIDEAKEIIRLTDPKATIPKKGEQIGNKIKFVESDGESDEESDRNSTSDDEGAKDSEPQKIIVNRAKRVLAILKPFL
ncbi:hypothetical protein SpCBS45565_g00855 [Spizellomyces sp. 'palustris']|nr:hypothetical protein SpCBS45565_g00855 [Spizellomyces sp. 'palustris']